LQNFIKRHVYKKGFHALFEIEKLQKFIHKHLGTKIYGKMFFIHSKNKELHASFESGKKGAKKGKEYFEFLACITVLCAKVFGL
jgi:hypothetical protein